MIQVHHTTTYSIKTWLHIGWLLAVSITVRVVGIADLMYAALTLVTLVLATSSTLMVTRAAACLGFAP